MECDELFPGEPHPGRPHDVDPQLYPLLHLHARQVLNSVFCLHSRIQDKEAARSFGVQLTVPTKDAAVTCLYRKSLHGHYLEKNCSP